MVDDGIFSTGRVTVIADDPRPVVIAPKPPKKGLARKLWDWLKGWL